MWINDRIIKKITKNNRLYFGIFVIIFYKLFKVNEDIYEKLSLVEYHKYYCQILNKKPVSKVYFALQDTDKKADKDS